MLISTFPSEDIAASTARTLVESGLCACASIFPMRSIYTWKGAISDEKEFSVIFKTSAASAASLKKEILRVHPYEVPEIIELGVASASRKYLEWVAQSTQAVAQKRNNSAKGRNPQANVR
ncbi:MAG TPA: divalent-cation tolerance protein CutA [Nitrososphaera sp.]|nr:divalent-cation tolerance protein CutA [Nitrososphaera sp.]